MGTQSSLTPIPLLIQRPAGHDQSVRVIVRPGHVNDVGRRAYDAVIPGQETRQQPERIAARDTDCVEPADGGPAAGVTQDMPPMGIQILMGYVTRSTLLLRITTLSLCHLSADHHVSVPRLLPLRQHAVQRRGPGS
jgi:hypothetical protein